MTLLRELRQLNGGRSEYVFFGLKPTKRPISDMTLVGALRRMGYSRDQLVTHSSRLIFRILANEAQWPADAIERQRAHVDNSVRGAYVRGAHFDVRIEMMQWRGDRPDSVANGDGGNVAKRI